MNLLAPAFGAGAKHSLREPGRPYASQIRQANGSWSATATSVIRKEEYQLMRVYEILFIISPTVEETDVEGLITQFTEVATNQGARVTKVDRMGRRRLAYPVQKFKDGHYVVLTIEGTGAEIAEIERRMRVTDAIIRYLSIRVDEDLKRAEKFRSRRAAHSRAGRAAAALGGHSASDESTAEEEG
jgi:small subunit ribosomal protein S6